MDMNMDMNGNSSCDDDLSMDMGGMKMFFHFDACETLLFQSVKITNAGDLVGAVIVCYVLAVLYEGLKTLREWLLHREDKRNRESRQKYYEKINSAENARSERFNSCCISLGMHVLQSLLHVVQVGYGYILMLVAMTFNGWLFLAVCFGAGTGYFIFGKLRQFYGNGLAARESNEHCH